MGVHVLKGGPLSEWACAGLKGDPLSEWVGLSVCVHTGVLAQPIP